MSPQEILERLPKLRALVVGDICLDRWCTYDPSMNEPSRETGLTRAAVVSTVNTPGAGGTVANNLAALGVGHIAVLGTYGDDGHGYELFQSLKSSRIDPSLMVRTPGQTFTYTKLLNAATGEEDLGRVDYIAPPPSAEAEAEILRRLCDAAPGYDVVLISDQMELETGGVVTPALRDALAGLAVAQPHLIVWVDSRLRAEKFRNVIVKPNEREAKEACERLGVASYAELHAHIGHSLMMITHGGEGVAILNGSGEKWVPTRKVEQPVDICGAGDSFSAGAAMALAAGATPEESVHFGHLVASITIMKKGTGTASPEEVLEAAAQP